MMNFKKLYDTKLKKAIVYGGLGLATITGTFGGNEEGLSPIYNKKVGTSYGINIGLSTTFMKDSKFYGISASLFSINCGGNLNGINAFCFGGSSVHKSGRINGLEFSLFNFSPGKETNELLVSAPIINGGQIGLVNNAKAGNCVQLGGYNSIEKENGKMKRGFLLNYHFKGRSRQ